MTQLPAARGAGFVGPKEEIGRIPRHLCTSAEVEDQAVCPRLARI